MNSTGLARQRGAIAIMFGLSVLGLLGVIGLALDLGLIYNRKAELQSLADATALAAASQLNGTAAGVADALTAAASTAANFRYQYNHLAIPWSSAALRFSAAARAAESDWVSADTAQAAPAGRLFVRVDTAALDTGSNGGLGTVNTVFMRIFSSAFNSTRSSARAVAGRASTNVVPLAVCALSPLEPAASRANVKTNASYNELVEYGFRRGVGYDLMNLNPNGTSPEHFLIDPMAPPGVPGTAADMAAAVTGPFVCSGSMPMPSALGGPLTLQRGFPIGALYPYFNARFDDSGNHCTAEGAPPDINIRTYPYGAITWMSAFPTTQTAASWTSGGTKLWTRADPLPGDATNTASLYGPLWAAAKAVPYSAYTAAPIEPAAGYATFPSTAWASLYTPGPPTAKSYPASLLSSTPYLAISGTYFAAPTNPGLPNRRMLNVALLACPVAAGSIVSAPVLAVGKFFMTVAATKDSLPGEFAGVASPASLGGAVELQR